MTKFVLKLPSLPLDPDLKVVAPVREWKWSREEEIEYAKANGVQFQQTLIILTQSTKTFGDVPMSVVFLRKMWNQAQKRLWDYQFTRVCAR